MPARTSRSACVGAVLRSDHAILPVLGVWLLVTWGCTSWSVLWAESYWRGVHALDIGDLERADEELRSSLFYARSRPSFWVMHVPSLEQLARVAILDGRPKDAVHYLGEALSLRRSFRGVRSGEALSVSTPILLHSLAQSLHTGARLVEVGFVKSGVEIHRRYLEHLGSGHYRDVDLARVSATGTLAVALMRVGETERALPHFERVVEYGVKIEDERSYGLLPIYLEYADLLESLERVEEAEDLRSVVREIGGLPDYFDVVEDEFDRAGVANWSPAELPFRLHVDPGPSDWRYAGDATSLVAEAAADWSDTVRPGVPSFVFVDDPEQAHIEIRWAPLESAANGMVGHAEPRISLVDRHIQHFAVTVLIGSPRAPVGVAQLEHVLRHELGHAMGLLGHSPSPDDLMYPALDRGSPTPSDRDIATLRQLFPCEPGEGAGLVVTRRAKEQFQCEGASDLLEE